MPLQRDALERIAVQAMVESKGPDAVLRYVADAVRMHATTLRVDGGADALAMAFDMAARVIETAASDVQRVLDA